MRADSASLGACTLRTVEGPVEWLDTATKNVRMDSLLASVHVEFDRIAPQPTTPLSVAVAAGATALHRRTFVRRGPARSTPTWKLTPSVALDLSTFQSGIASNTRVRTYRYQDFHFLWNLATAVVTPIDPGAPVPPPFITVPPLVLLPLPLPTVEPPISPPSSPRTFLGRFAAKSTVSLSARALRFR